MTSTDPIDEAEASIVAKEPVLAAFLTAAATGAAANWAHLHYGTDVDTVQQWITPIVTGSVLTGLGIIVRELVVPLATSGKRMEAEVDKRVNTILKNQALAQKPAVAAPVKAVGTTQG